MRTGLDDPAAKPDGLDVRWYSWLFVVVVGTVAIVLAVVVGASKYQLGYVIYGVVGLVGIVIPSILAFAANRIVQFPSLYFTITKLRHRLHAVAVIIIAGLTILAVHLAFYPWPDITHESASFAGLNPDAAQIKAERALGALPNARPGLRYSTQAKSVVDGRDVWLVYFNATNPGGATCVISVTGSASASASAECSS